MERIWEDVKAGIKAVAREAEDLTRVGRLRLQIVGIGQKIERCYIRIGKRIYQEAAGGSRTVALGGEIRELLERIDALAEERKQKEAEIRRIERKE
jgi:hypothetical protein